jgi:hypothetical protein
MLQKRRYIEVDNSNDYELSQKVEPELQSVKREKIQK